VTRYLAYAIGEIVLVVIGILIALQVNNWNEERQERNQAAKFLVALRDDLARDTLLLKSALDWSVKDSTLLGQMRRALSADDVTRDTLVALARYRFSPWTHLGISFNNNTYVSLQATGALNSLPETLRNTLQELNTLQLDYTRQSEADENLYLNQTILYGNNYPFNDVGHIAVDSRLADLIWASADFEQLATSFNALMGVKYSNYYAHLPELEQLLAKTREILKRLDAPK
jgi:hypothetical protein